ncbi:hypothetical protein Acr_11g0009620 [Actinidia rufa]|uniref:Reverse transcriptase zinc-binding domain-containing protein n=1 Tax=Actinidia rufa TaxID=165716 RepID=A0A7J0FE01_9ERIC|nr:hypothetical protein Acr_11g0009620 [Actinidia rufa]
MAGGSKSAPLCIMSLYFGVPKLYHGVTIDVCGSYEGDTSEMSTSHQYDWMGNTKTIATADEAEEEEGGSGGGGAIIGCSCCHPLDRLGPWDAKATSYAGSSEIGESDRDDYEEELVPEEGDAITVPDDLDCPQDVRLQATEGEERANAREEREEGRTQKKITSFAGPFSGNLMPSVDSKLELFNQDEELAMIELEHIRESNFLWELCLFSSEDDKANVLGKGPYIIYGRPLLLKAMPPLFKFGSEAISSFPVWVQLRYIPLDMWCPKVFGIICSKIGKPIYMDKLTTQKERITYARCLVEIDMAKEIKHSVKVNLNFPGGGIYEQPIFYENLPRFCSLCKNMGHTKEGCKANSNKCNAAKPNEETTEKGIETEATVAGNNEQPGTPGARTQREIQMEWVTKKTREGKGQKGNSEVRMNTETQICNKFSPLDVSPENEENLIQAAGPEVGTDEAQNQDVGIQLVNEVDQNLDLGTEIGTEKNQNSDSRIGRETEENLGKARIGMQGPSSFKFFNMWAIHEDFQEIVERVWGTQIHGSAMFRLCRKLKLLKEPLKEQVAELKPLAFRLTEAERSYCSQLAKMRYFKNSDKGTKVFHDMIKRNRNKGQIVSLSLSDGTRTTSNQEVSNAFVNYYKELLGTGSNCAQLDKDILLDGKLVQEEQSNVLIRDVSDGEIKEALFSIGDDKAPRPDGFSSFFYKKAWNVVGKEFCDAVKEFYKGLAGMTLSYAGRCELIKSILQGVECFWLASLPIPAGRGDDVCLPKMEGGLGLKNLEAWNVALLSKKSMEHPCQERYFMGLKNRLLTRDKLQGIIEDQSYPLCRAKEESIDHLFFQCNVGKQVWTQIKQWLGITRAMNTLKAAVKWLIKEARGTGVQAKVKKIVLACTVYYLWEARNLRIFEGKIKHPEAIVRGIQIQVFRVIEGLYSDAVGPRWGTLS